VRAGTLVAAITLSAGITGLIVGSAAQQIAGRHLAVWVVGRASAMCAYVLLVALVLMGLLLSHPWRSRVRRPSTAARIRLHITLSVFTLVFITLHIVILATDRYAGVGWWGALVPMGASYRPVAITIGLIAVWSGLLAGITAALAGRLPRRLWWPIHKVASVALVLAWLHSVLGGKDTVALFVLYIPTAALLVVVGVSRYVAHQPADRIAELH
jgi:DMSO/TMAO reductase YedYZ heme-binding membrane subunit